MSAEPNTAKDIFVELVTNVAPEKCEEQLAHACRGDDELQNRVRALLRAHAEPGSFLQQPALTDDATVLHESPITERPGTVIGPYKLLQQIGEGGMGVVFMAEQAEPIQRTVALKIIKPGMDTRQVIARFEAERQALALMDHPNIARVLDAGTTDTGRPYFVMDLVKGVPITDYCDQQHLPVEKRLELMSAVCHAVQHAHQKGIIHRDLKPSNVLVAEYDGKPVPKVIDFGVAKATAQKLTERTMFTEFGQIVGTFEYMSPEQARFNQLDVDTRSDIYSLGVLLYELLAGSTPLEKERLRSAAFDEILRIIGEEEPPKPSTRLSSSESLASIAANRHTEPARLSKDVRGELDWIVMKCLEKDRNRRYKTANGLGLDLHRFLHDEAVQACPPSAIYRFRKFARRNRTALAIATLILFCLMFVVGSLGWALRDRSVRQAALQQGVLSALGDVEAAHRREDWPEAKTAIKRAAGLLAASDTPTALNERVRQWRTDLETVAQLEKLRLSDSVSEKSLWRGRSAMHEEYRRAFGSFGVDIDSLAIEDAATRIRARPIRDQLIAALNSWTTLRRFLVGDDSETAQGKPSDWWARPLRVAGAVDTDELSNRVRRVVEKDDQEALLELANSPDVVRLPASMLELLVHEFQSGDISHLRAEIELLKRAQQARPDDFFLNYVLAIIRPDQSQGASFLVKRGKFAFQPGNDLLLGDEAIIYATAAVALRPRNGYAQAALGVALQEVGHLDAALSAYREAIRLEPNEIRTYGNLGNVLAQQGKLTEAIAVYGTLIKHRPDDVLAYCNLGVFLDEQGKHDEAIAIYRKAIELDPASTRAYSNLGVALSDQGKFDEAIAAYRKAIELDPTDAGQYSNLGNVLQRLRKVDEAVAAHRKAIELEPAGSLAATVHYNLGNALIDQGLLDEAVVAFRKAIEFDPAAADAYHNLGDALQQQGKPDEAVAAYRTAIEYNPADANAHHNLGNVLHELGKFEESIAASHKAIELRPNDADAYLNLGVALLDSKKIDEAVATYRKSIELNPQNGKAYANLGYALQQQGMLEEAVIAFRMAIDHHLDRFEVYENLGIVLQSQGHIDEAIVAYRKAIKLQPTRFAAYNNLASILATAPAPHRDPERALELATQAAGLGPTEGAAWNTLGIARYRLGQWQPAIEALEKSMKLRDGGDANDWFFLAMTHWQLGHKVEARNWYDKAVEWTDKNDPSNDELRRFHAESATLLGNPEPQPPVKQTPAGDDTPDTNIDNS